MIKKSSQIEYARRINFARTICKSADSTQRATEVLSKHFGISYRQAYRYVKKALEPEEEQLIPEEKIVFTVRLPKRLVIVLRNYANLQRQQLSSLVGQILEEYLNSTEKDAKERTK